MGMAPVEQPGRVLDRGVAPGQLSHHRQLGPSVVVRLGKRSVGYEHRPGLGMIGRVTQRGVEEASVTVDERLPQKVIEGGAFVTGVEVQGYELGRLKVLVAAVATRASAMAWHPLVLGAGAPTAAA